jgi:hypothetical protein
MGALAEAFVTFLAHVHGASAKQTAAEKAKAEQGVADAAKNLMALYVAYVPSVPDEDPHDAAAVKLIEKVENMETFAALVIPE